VPGLAAANVTAYSSHSGNLRIHSLTDVRIEASTPDGGIEVTATGSLHAASITAGGSSPASAVRLIAQPDGDNPSSLTIGQLTTVPSADLVLTAEGPITWDISAGCIASRPACRQHHHHWWHTACAGCEHQPDPCHSP
jgi:hypothetical protein